VTRLVGTLIERAPPNVFVAVASRTLPALPHARLLAAGRMLGVAAEDLRFTPAEVGCFLGQPTDAEDVVDAYDATGGWVTALLLRDRGIGVPRALDDYLETEVWSQQSPEVQLFLLRASVPPTLTDDLCSRVLEQPRGPAYLMEAHRAGLFVAALPDGGWRLHDLFRDFLRARLRRGDPEMWKWLHLTLADEMVADRQVSDAISLLVDAEQYERAADLLLEHASEMANAGRWGAIRQWFERLPPRIVDRRPRLHTLHARALRPVADADAVLAAFDAGVVGCQRLGDGIGAAEGLGQRAARLGLSGRYAEAADDCRHARELLGGRDHPVMATVLRIEGMIAASTSRYDDAFDLLREALARAQRHRQPFEAAVCERSLGWTLTLQGKYGEATAHFERSAKAWQEIGDLGAAAEVRVSLGNSYREQGAVELARRAFEDALEQAERVGQRRALGYALDNLGILDREAGLVDEAIERIEAALEIARATDDAELLSQCLDQLAQCHRIGGDGRRAAEAFARQAVAEAERLGNRPLVERTRATLAAALLAQGRVFEAWEIARQTADALAPTGRKLDLVRASLAAAVAGEQIGQPEWARYLIAAADAVASLPNRGFLRAEVQALGPALRAIAASPDAHEVAAALLAAAGDTTTPIGAVATTKSQVSLPRLTVRLLGRPALLIDEHQPRDISSSWSRRMTRELFFLLEANRSGLSADALIERLWSDAQPGRGQALLWTHAHRVRSALSGGDKELGRRMLLTEAGHYRLNPDLAIVTDVAAFNAAASRALALPLDAPGAGEALAQAEAAYSGDYLEGFAAPWVLGRRNALEKTYLQVLRRRVEQALVAGAGQDAVTGAERLLKHDPYSENACRLLVRAFLTLGNRERARAAYRAFARRFERHLDAPPSQALAELAGA
jgi:DNA-binding SARP family transcriptional activator